MSTLDTLKMAQYALEEAEAAYDEALEKAVKEHHPVQIGDHVTVNGYSYEGKTMEVTSRRVLNSWRTNGWGWFAAGRVLKADGTPGKNVGEWHQAIEAEQ